MSDPIVEKIADNIADELAEITVANGFSQTLGPIVRPRQPDFGNTTWADLTVLVVQGDTEPVKSETGLTFKILKFKIVAIVQDGDNGTDPIDIRKNQVAADIEKKLMEDIRRGLAANCWGTEVGPVEPFNDSAGKSSGVIVNVEVRIAHVMGNPYA